MNFAERRSIRRRALVAVATLVAVAISVTAGMPEARAEGGPITLSRLAAADRFATAATIATTTFGTSGSVFLARGDDPNGFADALAANYPAGLLNAPVLLTLPTQVPQPTLDALTALGAQNVTILGGEGAISAGVQQTLAARGLTVGRVGGNDRFETAANVARVPGLATVGRNEDGLRTAVLSSGRSFPDALAAGGLVWARHLPQLLTETAALPPATEATLRDLDIEHVILTGGTGVIAGNVEALVQGLGISVERIAGGTRYDTAVAIANKSVTDFGFSATHVEVATGESFPDALAGGGHAGRATAPTILTPETTAGPAACGYVQSHAGLVDGHVLGGAAAVSEAVVAALGQRCPAAPPGGTVTVSGHGWGHGRGLGQFGAQGYAVDHGWSAADILNWFYGNSTAGTMDPAAIRVRLQAYDGQSPRVTSGSSFNAGGQLGLAAGSAAWLTYDAGAWTVHVAPNCAAAETASFPATDQYFTSNAGDPGNDLTKMVAICDGAGPGVPRVYRGGFHAALDSEGPLRFVNEVGLEAYLRGVVPRESPSGWDADALQAQAVAARSYAASENRYSYADTCDTTSCQVYRGAGEGTTRIEAQSTDEAIGATAGIVRRMNGTNAIARTEFSSSTGGHTAGGTFAPVVDEGDDIASNPNHNWTTTLDRNAVGAQYGVGAVQSIEVVARTTADGGRRASNVRITGSNGTKDVSGEVFRGDWNLKSTWFSFGG
jgi:SpoIID/LytB domain protein